MAIELKLTPPVAVIMGSQSDWKTMRHTSEILHKLDIAHHNLIISAHRTPLRLYGFANGAQQEGYKVIIAGAGGAAHLPGMTASLTLLPVIGVPCPSSSNALNDDAAIKSILFMPGGVPVATVTIGEAGAKNAALIAARILALGDKELSLRLRQFADEQTNGVPTQPVDEPAPPAP
jgi:5-(carboxyamino)imidazole ribonucleotide mutase